MKTDQIKINQSYKLVTGAKFTVTKIKNNIVGGYIEGKENLLYKYPCNMLECEWNSKWDIPKPLVAHQSKASSITFFNQELNQN
jgi:hypothetical protein